MSMLQQIKTDQLLARKLRKDEVTSLLTTLIGEATMVGKNDGNRETTDVEVVAIIKKFIKNSKELILAVGSSPAAVAAQREIDVLESYLPKQFTGDDLRDVIHQLAVVVGASTQKDMGRLMKELKTHYDGQYDGKEASVVVKEVLS